MEICLERCTRPLDKGSPSVQGEQNKFWVTEIRYQGRSNVQQLTVSRDLNSISACLWCFQAVAGILLGGAVLLRMSYQWFNPARMMEGKTERWRDIERDVSGWIFQGKLSIYNSQSCLRDLSVNVMDSPSASSRLSGIFLGSFRLFCEWTIPTNVLWCFFDDVRGIMEGVTFTYSNNNWNSMLNRNRFAIVTIPGPLTTPDKFSQSP